MANINESKKYHFLYKTTNITNGKYYIGMHSTSNLKDGYLGSGKRLRYSIRKYGVECFKLEILEFFDSREALKNKERALVNEALLQDSMCMNLKPGGSGGFANKKHQQRACSGGGKALSAKLKVDENLRQRLSAIRSEQLKKTHDEGKIKYKGFVGHQSDEVRAKISATKKGTGTGEKNSQFGTMWITNGVENKKLKKDNTIPLGWYKGYNPKK